MYSPQVISDFAELTHVNSLLFLPFLKNIIQKELKLKKLIKNFEIFTMNIKI